MAAKVIEITADQRRIGKDIAAKREAVSSAKGAVFEREGTLLKTIANHAGAKVVTYAFANGVAAAYVEESDKPESRKAEKSQILKLFQFGCLINTTWRDIKATREYKADPSKCQDMRKELTLAFTGARKAHKKNDKASNPTLRNAAVTYWKAAKKARGGSDASAEFEGGLVRFLKAKVNGKAAKIQADIVALLVDPATFDHVPKKVRTAIAKNYNVK